MIPEPKPRMGESGVTLIELLLTLGLGALIVTVFSYSLVGQRRHFQGNLDAVEAQENGRVAVEFIRFYVRQAGWGMRPSLDALGVAPIGTCFDDSAATTTALCDNRDTFGPGDSYASDRVRVVLGRTPDFVFLNSAAGPSLATGNQIWIGNNNAPDPQPDGRLTRIPIAIISGRCLASDGPSDLVGTDLLRVQPAAPASGYWHAYTYAPMLQAQAGLSCAGGYAAGFNFGPVRVLDFFIDHTDANHPILRMRTHPIISGANGDEVARDIEDFQIRYGIDLDDVIGPELWCDDPANAVTCPTGLPTIRSNLARIVAVRIVLVSRTTTYRTAQDTERPASLVVQNNTLTDTSDGYRRFVFRATVALRNYPQ